MIKYHGISWKLYLGGCISPIIGFTLLWPAFARCLILYFLMAKRLVPSLRNVAYDKVTLSRPTSSSSVLMFFLACFFVWRNRKGSREFPLVTAAHQSPTWCMLMILFCSSNPLQMPVIMWSPRWIFMVASRDKILTKANLGLSFLQMSPDCINVCWLRNSESVIPLR